MKALQSLYRALQPQRLLPLLNKRLRHAVGDAILREVHERSGGKPFDKIEDVISAEEMKEISARYKRVAGFEIEQLKARAALV